MANHEWSEGRSVSGLKGAAGSVTDCSDWESDIPEEKWSEGRSVCGAKGIAGSVTDCSADERSGVPDRLRVTTSPGVAVEVVSKHLNAVREALQAARAAGVNIEIAPGA